MALCLFLTLKVTADIPACSPAAVSSWHLGAKGSLCRRFSSRMIFFKAAVPGAVAWGAWCACLRVLELQRALGSAF